MDSNSPTWYCPFRLSLVVQGLFMVFAFASASPVQILKGMVTIIKSQSILVTDYVAIAGIGPTLFNAALTGGVTTLIFILAKVKPHGGLIMAIWHTTGFAFFGKNVFNVLPITLGVFLYSRWQKRPFSRYALVAVLASTLAPAVSEITFMGRYPWYIEIPLGLAAGIVIGFVMPTVARATMRVHNGYSLFNVGFAGGMLALFITAMLKSAGLEPQKNLYWSTGNNLFWAVFLYSVMALWIVFGVVTSRRRAAWDGFKKIMGHSGRLVSDYYHMHGDGIFFNMAAVGMLLTTVTLVIGAELNGASIAGILTAMGYAAVGLHPRNASPLMVGAFVSALFNPAPYDDPRNITAILFSTGLAPVAGRYGAGWGVVAGMLHVTIVYHLGSITGGLNLYNNGFSAGFVAFLLVPLIDTVKVHYTAAAIEKKARNNED